MLKPGAELRSYEIVALAGKGGMGEVYQARDTRLDRRVAIKVLPQALTLTEERVLRFQREAKLLATLNHPNIAQIYGFEEERGTSFIVLEFVEGETLADRLARGPLSVDEALEIARQIAEAVAAAHERGVIHRDLKPGNVKLRPDGTVKVLDFGLAKALGNEEGALPDESPTITAGFTRPGLLLGTASYMSPEQARGQPADRRADVWAFGALLYECLTGRAPFRGPTTTDVLGAIVGGEPDWSALPASLPPTAARVVRRCLVKDPKMRLHDISDARIEIEVAQAGDSAAVEETARRPAGDVSPRLFTATVAALVLFVASTAWLLLRPPTATPATSVGLSVTEASIGPAPASAHLHGPTLAIAPDGSRLAFVGTQEGVALLFVRELAGGESQPIPGTEGAVSPFFSPDGRHVGFMARGVLRTVALDGTPPRDVCPAPGLRGAAWTEGGEIVFSKSMDSALWRVPASGGTAQPLTRLDAEAGETYHGRPEPLPGGRKLLFLVRFGTPDGSRPISRAVALTDLDTGEHSLVARNLHHARYAGDLLLSTGLDGTISAIPFDPRRGTTSGSPITVLGGVSTKPMTGTSEFAIARNGTLAFVPGDAGAPHGRVVWIDRDGRQSAALSELERYTAPRLSPSGRYLIVGIAGPGTDLWRYDLKQRPPTRLRLTYDGLSVLAVWSPDEGSTCYSSGRSGTMQIYCVPADGSGKADPLQVSDHAQVPTSWSSDGKLLAYMEHRPETGFDIWIKPLDGDAPAWTLAGGSTDETEPSFSPDSRWVAYSSMESGTPEVYVQAVRSDGARYPVSVGGGTNPLWHGNEIRYRRGDMMMTVAVRTDPEFSASAPVALFDGLPVGMIPARMYDVETAGDRTVVTVADRPASRPYQEIKVITGWVDRIHQRLAEGG